SGRHSRVLHGAQGVVRAGCRTDLPAALADDSEGGSDAFGARPPREALLPARPEGQGRADEGHGREKLKLKVKSQKLKPEMPVVLKSKPEMPVFLVLTFNF